MEHRSYRPPREPLPDPIDRAIDHLGHTWGIGDTVFEKVAWTATDVGHLTLEAIRHPRQAIDAVARRLSRKLFIY
jgi:hypothetical protein